MASPGKYSVDQGRFGLSSALAGKTRVEARDRVDEWRNDLSMLNHHIHQQMEYCKQLRNHETLRKLVEEDPEERDRKLLIAFVESSLADIRTLHSEVAERMLGMPESKADPGSLLSSAAANASMEKPWQKRTMELEEQLAAFKKPLRSGTITTKHVMQLVFLRQGLLVELSEFLVASKRRLDSTLGIAVDIATTVDDDSPIMRASRDIRSLLKVTSAFENLQTLVHQANLTADGVRHSKALAGMRQQRDAALEQLADAKAHIAELQETAANLREGIAGKSQQTLKLDEAVTRMRQLEHRDAGLTRQNAELARSNGILQQQVLRMKRQLEESQAKLKADTEWYQPRIAKLESNVAEAEATIQTVMMDVELLGSMYKSGVQELEDMQKNVVAANKERKVFADKLHVEIQKLMGLHNEVQRQQNITIQLNAARRSALDAYDAAKQRGAEADQTIQELRKELAEKAATIRRLEQELVDTNQALDTSRNETVQSVAECGELKAGLEHSELRREQLSRDLDDMTQKVIEAGLDEAGKTRYDRAQAQLIEAQKMHSFLEAKLEATHGHNKSLRAQVASLQKRMVEEGIELDDL